MTEKEYRELIAACLSGELLAEAQKELEAWRNKDALNEQLFSEAERIWNITGKLKKDDFNPNIENAWNKLKEKIEKQTKAKPKIISLPQWTKIAAAIALLGVLVYFLKTLTESPTPSEGIIAEEQNIKQIIIHSSDSVLNFFLPDSSQLWLNKKSHVYYAENFKDTAHIVYLAGEAYFEVKHSVIPFMVIAKENIIKVTGTSFNVRAYEDEEKTEVSVLSGEVEFHQKDKPEEITHIRKDETVTFDETTGKPQKQKSKNQNQWWKTATKTIQKFLRRVEGDIKKEIKKQRK